MLLETLRLPSYIRDHAGNFFGSCEKLNALFWALGLLNDLHQKEVLLAGMNIAASPQLAAAVTNAGGLGVWGGVFYTPKMFRAKLKDF